MAHDVDAAAEARRIAEQRVTGLGRLLTRTAACMVDQREFHSGGAIEDGVRTLRDGAARAERRIGSVPHAGSRWLREIEKTLIAELARATWLADEVCEEAGDVAWPDLAEAAEECRREIRAAAERDASLFAPSGFDAADVRSRAAASLSTEADWRVMEEGCFAAVAQSGIPLAVAAWRHGGSNLWLASVGGVGVGLVSEPDGAARRAEDAYRSLFGAAAVEAGAVACAPGA